MKYICLIIILLASVFFASCERDNADNDYTQNIEDEKDSNIFSGETVERISYSDYVKLYDDVDPQIAQEPLYSENNSELPNNNENSENNKATSFQTTNPNELAKYSTPLLSSSKARVNNIEIVCDRLNNFILQPNEIFSYNEVTGPFGPDDGFEESTILLSDGSKSKGYGGGVCQLSSTLYNVVKNIDNIEITERHHHSAPVEYVPEGEDATVSLQSGLDFKFKNNNDYSVKFEAKCTDNNVTVWAYKEI